MKHLFFALSLCTAFACSAQTYPEPDFANVPVWYDANSSILKNFERLPVNKGGRMSGAFSAETVIIFTGETSTTQFALGKLPPFIIKMNSATEDPAGTVELGALQVNKRKHQREFIAAKAGMAGSKSTIITLPLNFKKLSSGVYQIVPAQELGAGEYVISVGTKAFLFSISNPNAK